MSSSSTRVRPETLIRRLFPSPQPAGEPVEIANWSTAGGSGKTTITVLLAQTLLHLRPSSRILVWDLDFYFGDLGPAMGVSENSNITNVLDARSSNRDNPAILEASLASAIFQHASGVDVLAAPDSPLDAQQYPVTKESFVQIREALVTRGYDLILYDLPCNLFISEVAATAFIGCAIINLLLSKHSVGQSSLRRILPVLENRGLLPRTRLIVNRSDDKPTASEIKEAFGEIPLLGYLPSDGLISSGTVKGRALWSYQPFQNSYAASKAVQLGVEVWDIVDASRTREGPSSKPVG